MSEKQFVVEELEILNDENDFKGEYWWAVTNTERVEDCFECRNKEVALKLCDFLNKSSDDFKWQIRQCEKWSAIVKRLKKENEQLRKIGVMYQGHNPCSNCTYCLENKLCCGINPPMLCDEMKKDYFIYGLCKKHRQIQKSIRRYDDE